MRLYLIIPLTVLLSCRSVKNSSTIQDTDLLLKDVKVLSSDQYKGRQTGTDGALMTRTYIKNRLKEIGVKSYPSLKNYEQNFTVKGSKGETINAKNLIAYIPGKTASIMVLSAHYDHLGIIENEVYNGADDNASGVAGLLKIAAYYAKNKPNNSMLFAFFDAGELGWKGSKAFIERPPVDLERIKLNINLDMISHNDKNILYAAGTFKHPELKGFIHYSNPDLKILFGHDNPKQGVDDWTNQSDQGAFNTKNIPFIYFGVEDHQDYHKSSDEYESINPSFFINAAQAILEIVENIDQQKDIQSIFKQTLKMKKQ